MIELMLTLPELISKIFASLQGIHSWIFLVIFTSLVFLSFIFFRNPNKRYEDAVFWISVFLLTLYAGLRPLGIGRDDSNYIWTANNICAFSECLKFIQSSRDWLWYSAISVLKSIASSERALLLLSSAGTFIQLSIIGKLCKNKLVALVLFLPLGYIYFDITLLRAGSALTLFFIALYLVSTQRKYLGSMALLGNYFIHSQGIFSIGILPFSLLTKHKKLCFIVVIILVACIYLNWVPGKNLLYPLMKTESTPYYLLYLNGHYNSFKLFPSTYLLILFYFVTAFLLTKNTLSKSGIENYAFGSIFLAIFLAWFFSNIQTMQTRLFDFYVIPIIFLAGNITLNKKNFCMTIGLAIILYCRIELLHNWIMG